jgi:hypothetical protein
MSGEATNIFPAETLVDIPVVISDDSPVDSPGGAASGGGPTSSPEVNNPVDLPSPENIKEKHARLRRSINKSFYKIEIVNVASSISSINKFMTLHPEIFKTNINKKIVYLVDSNVYSIYTEPMLFRDTIHKVSGFITSSMIEDKIIMTVHINKNNRNKECYIKQIENYVNHQTKYGNNVELYYYKILSENIVKHCFYNEPVEQWQKDIVILQNEFFSAHKDYLFSIINSKAKNSGIGNTSSSWNNLILYGAPGTGKSSFIYRIAMMLKLSILSVDLSLYLNKKKELYSMFHGQEFSLPSSSAKENAIGNAIIVLEEFDHAIDKLLDIENIFKYKDVIKREYLNMKNEEIKSRTSELLDTHIDKKTLEKEENMIKERLAAISSGTDMDYEAFVKMEQLKDGFDMENNVVYDKARQNVLKKRDFDNEICSINAELDNIIRSMDEDNKSNILRLSDMLELFGGPVPIKNRIIVATTNNFEKIREAFPPLFRAGRMTPVNFDYLDWESLNNLCMYYFQKTMVGEPRPITIPTSQVIELAIKHVLTKKTFEEFERELMALL